MEAIDQSKTCCLINSNFAGWRCIIFRHSGNIFFSLAIKLRLRFHSLTRCANSRTTPSMRELLSKPVIKPINAKFFLSLTLSLASSVAFADVGGTNVLSTSYVDSLAQGKDLKVQLAILKASLLRRRAQAIRVESSSKKKLPKEVLAYDIALAKIEVLESSRSPVERESAAKYVANLNYSLKVDGDIRGIEAAYEHFKAITHTWYVSKSNQNEARNLDPSSTNDPSDLSTMNPLPDSSVWHNPGDIRAIDLDQYFYGGQNPLYQGKAVEFPTLADTQPIFLKKIDRSQTSGKLNVFIKASDGSEKDFTFKMFKETHADPTVSALQSLLGYHTDVMKHASMVRVYLPANLPVKKFFRDFMDYYRPERVSASWNVHDYVAKDKSGNEIIGRDANGEYIVFLDGMFEAKFQNLVRVGNWPFDDLNNQYLREVRALMIFNVWIANTDMTYANNKVLIRKEDGQMFMLQHDSSRAIGGLLPENLDAFDAKLIKENNSKEIAFKFRSALENPLRGQLTINDARWIVRLIGRISRAQIEKAVSYGLWPKQGAPADIVEKLIARRNDLVTNFGLEKDVGLMPVDLERTTPDGTLQKGKLVQTKYENDPQEYGHYWRELVAPVGRFFKQSLVKAAQAGISGFSGYTYSSGGVEFGVDKGLITEGILNINRQVTENPNPTSDQDRFLVQDTYKLGARLGAGYILSGSGALVYKYTLVYPVGTYDDSNRHGVVDFTLPYDVMKKRLPDNSVLMVERYAEGTFRIRTPDYAPIDIGGEHTDARIDLDRRIIDFKANSGRDIVLYQDHANYNDSRVRALLQLFGVVNIPLVENSVIWDGSLRGNAYLVTRSETTPGSQMNAAVSRAIWPGNFDSVASLKQPVDLQATFKAKGWWANLLGFFKRRELISNEVLTLGSATSASETFGQSRSVGVKGWTFLDNGEAQEAKIYARGPKNKDFYSLADTTVDIEFSIFDVETVTDELVDKDRVNYKNGYFNFVDGLALDSHFIKYEDIRETSRNQKWSSVNGFVNLQYGPAALVKIFEMSNQKYWESLATVLNVPGADYNYLKKNFGKIVSRSNEFLSLLESARKQKTAYARLEQLTNAFRWAIWTYRYTFSPVIFAALNNIVSTNSYYLRASFQPPFDRESVFPSGNPFAERGTPYSGSNRQLILFPVDGIEVYNMLNRFDVHAKIPRAIDVHERN